MPRGSNKKETEKPDETLEKVEETPIVQDKTEEKTVEKPLNLAEKSPQELAELQANIRKQEQINHIKAEAKRIKELSCPKCGENLGLNPKNYMKQGNLPESMECKGCERLISVYINYKEDPTISKAEISTKAKGYVWINQLPSTWQDKHTIKWVEQEKERLLKNQSTLSPDNQKLFRVQLLILEKLKIIK